MQGQLQEQIPLLLAGSLSDDSTLELDKESKKRLESIGYVGTTSFDDAFELDKTKRNDKDIIR